MAFSFRPESRSPSTGFPKVRDKAGRKKIKLFILPTVEAIELLNQNPKKTNAIVHITC